MNRRFVAFAIVVAAAVAVVAVVLRPGPRPPGRRLAVASILPLADIVRNVAGDRFEVSCLLPPGASPHTFEPTTRQMVELSQAEAFFRMGLDLEFWAADLVESAANPRLRVVTVSDGIEPLRFSSHGEHADEEAEGHHHEHGEFDPHVWLDPVLALTIAENVRLGLSAADPASAGYFSERAREYREKLVALDAEYKAAMGAIKVRKAVAFHDAYAYLARRYGYEIVEVIEEAPGKEPGAKHIQHVIEGIRASGAGAVFVEPQFSPLMAEAIARDAGVAVITVDPIGDSSDPLRATYIGLMRFNLDAFRRAAAGGGDR